jgi:hypothetical protein
MPVVFRRRLAALLAAVLLAAPAPAFGQSAGDDQYEDPFAGEDQGQPQSGGGQEPAPAPAPAAPAPAPAAESSTPSAPAAEPASQQQQLPRTGLDAAPILAIGVVLLGSGVALRVRLRERS